MKGPSSEYSLRSRHVSPSRLAIQKTWYLLSRRRGSNKDLSWSHTLAHTASSFNAASCILRRRGHGNYGNCMAPVSWLREVLCPCQTGVERSSRPHRFPPAVCLANSRHRFAFLLIMQQCSSNISLLTKRHLPTKRHFATCFRYFINPLR